MKPEIAHTHVIWILNLPTLIIIEYAHRTLCFIPFTTNEREMKQTRIKPFERIDSRQGIKSTA